MLIGQGGVIQQSQEAQNAQKNYSEKEEGETNSLISQIDEELKPDWKDSSGANIPKLGTGMVPVKWNGSNWIVTNSKDSEWFNYSEKKWANIMLRDGLEVEGVEDATTASIATMRGKKVTKLGSMFVWIPRYGYQIESGYHQSGSDINPDDGTLGAGIINIEFMKGTSNVGVKGRTKWDNASGEGNWNIHPAFDYGGIVEGIWVAKFEASHTGCTTDVSTGQTDTNRTDLTLQVKPGVTSWRNITIGNIYTVCLNYNTSLNSHMMKNNEWGAVAYLTQSKYGKNSKVWLNNSSSFITGSAGNSASAGVDIGTTNDYTNSQGVNASTTGNVTGIYDMSGGNWEYVASYVNNGHENLEKYANSLINGTMRTKDVYVSTNPENLQQNYNIASKQYGDAIYEISSGTYYDSTVSNTQSWYADYSNFPSSLSPFFIRGGGYMIGGLYYFSAYYGEDFYYGFRTVLIT